MILTAHTNIHTSIPPLLSSEVPLYILVPVGWFISWLMVEVIEFTPRCNHLTVVHRMSTFRLTKKNHTNIITTWDKFTSFPFLKSLGFRVFSSYTVCQSNLDFVKGTVAQSVRLQTNMYARWLQSWYEEVMGSILVRTKPNFSAMFVVSCCQRTRFLRFNNSDGHRHDGCCELTMAPGLEGFGWCQVCDRGINR